ncbi:hypothetical protein DFH07DRAFT_965868 [Mycena maculata]|uniref:Uncharacterized protein n=1 Tax=Mycena maculata TaxID=230809 RepID=A0AAD7ICV1_9AGAR|nr:hypothetical protein DFH07DRAFT_965868 [Mycena maculata]
MVRPAATGLLWGTSGQVGGAHAPAAVSLSRPHTTPPAWRNHRAPNFRPGTSAPALRSSPWHLHGTAALTTSVFALRANNAASQQRPADTRPDILAPPSYTTYDAVPHCSPSPSCMAKTRVEISQSPAPLLLRRMPTKPKIQRLRLTPLPRPLVPQEHTQHQLTHRPPARVRHEYGFPPLPPRTSEMYDEFAPRKQPAPAPYLEYTSGVMMANHRLEAILPKPLKPGERAPPLKLVPGWTDGSQAWCTSTYSFAPPPKTRADVLNPNRTVYEGFVASPHRSTQSSVTASGEHPSSAPASPTVLQLRMPHRLAHLPLQILPGTSPASSTGISPPQKQRPLAQAAVGGMLLVSDVMKCTAVAGSTTSLTAAEHRDSFTSASSGRDRHDSNLSSSSITSMLMRERTARRQPTPLLGD